MGNREFFGITSSQVAYLDGIRYLMHWHVPVFFMITGALLLNRARDLTITMCKKYARRILLALLVFGIPFALLELVFSTGSFSPQMVWKAVLNTINGDNWDHMWYLYTIVGIYLLLPLFKRFTDSADQSEVRYVLLVLALYDFCIPEVDALTGTHIGFAVPVAYPIFYLLLGKLLADKKPSWLNKRTICVAGLAATMCLAAVICVFFQENAGLVTRYDSPVIALGACFSFSLFKGLSVPDRWSAAIWKIDRLCFGVYLIHPVFINFVYKFLHLTPVGFSAFQFVLALFFFGFVILSFFASWVMSLIPPLKKYIL